MNPIQVSEILDIATYEEQRQRLRSVAMQAKEARRVRVGDHLTFLFENRDTVRYQIQEMMRVEHIIKAADIAHEVETYNELLPKAGQLSATLLIEYESSDERDIKLRELLGLENHVAVVVGNGPACSATFDDRQIATDRISAVQYVRWELDAAARKALSGSQPPRIELRVDHPAYSHSTVLSAAQAQALWEDFRLSAAHAAG